MALNLDHLRRFRRRTWATIAVCIALRATAAIAGFDHDEPALPALSPCLSVSELSSC